VRPALAVPFFLGGLAVGALGVGALSPHWEFRGSDPQPAERGRHVRIAAAADELEALATEPDNRTVALDPACAVACL
jgi:hypothetical protein